MLPVPELYKFSGHLLNAFTKEGGVDIGILKPFKHLLHTPPRQWHSQDEQVTWTQHGHIRCACNSHLLGKLGHTPAMKMFWNYTLLRWFLATNTILLVLPACSHHVAIGHANNNWSLSLAFHIIFIRAPVNFTWAQARVCPGVATPLPPDFPCLSCKCPWVLAWGNMVLCSTCNFMK